MIYHSPFGNSSLTKLESTQYQAALAISGAWKGTSAAKLYEDLGWETLAERRCYRRLLLFSKIINKMAPAYMLASVPSKYKRYRLRRQLDYDTYYCRTSKFKASFFPAVISDWTHLDKSLFELETYTGFKIAVTRIVRPSRKSTFKIHHPTGLRFLTQLRLGLSALRAHKYLHNFADTKDPNCLISYDGIEDTTHFLLECTAFSTQRTTLLDTVSSLLGLSVSDVCLDELCNILLYGHRERDSEINKNTLLATITFIVDTKRFS